MRKHAGDMVGSGLDKPEPENLGKRIVAGLRSLVKEVGAVTPSVPELKPAKIKRQPKRRRKP